MMTKKNTKLPKVTIITLKKSMMKIKELEKTIDDNEKVYRHTYCEYKKFKYSTENKSLVLDF